MDRHYDVVVVGSGPAGCAVAILYAKRGFSVALVERRKDMEAYKPVCTHFLQGCAIPVLDEVGVLPAVIAAGAVENRINIWSHFGWVKCSATKQSGHHGYVLRRQVLDPLLRKAANRHPNIDFYPGWKAIKLLEMEPKRIGGIVVQNSATGGESILRADLTVGADGRSSTIAELLGAKKTEILNKRTFYVTYYESLPLSTGLASQLWFWNKDIAYAFPCDGGLTLLCLGLHEDNNSLLKNNTELELHEYFKQLPDAPDMDSGRRIAPVTRGKCMHTVRRTHDHRGVALVGDALFSIDPFAGTGIGWAMEGASWLVRETEEALRCRRADDLDKALNTYISEHRRRLRGHTWMISSYSSGRDLKWFFPPEKLLLSAAVHRTEVAEFLDKLLNRVVQPKDLFCFRLVKSLFTFQWRRIWCVREREVRDEAS